MPITHSWNGTVLTITSDSGTSSCDLKGAKGDDGARGPQGKAGDCVATDTAMLGGIPATEYATKGYVEELTANLEPPEIDLTAYATKIYVDDAISAIDIPEQDLSNYYTKAETNTAINNALPDLSNYALKTDTAPNADKLDGFSSEEFAKANEAGMKLDILWENASPTSIFNSHTETIDANLSQYKGIIVITRVDINASQEWYHSTGVIPYVLNRGYRMATTHEYLIRRGFTITATNKINFGNCMYHNEYGNPNGVTANDFLVPQVIYGVK